MELKVLFIEDEKGLRENLYEIFHGASIENYILKVKTEESFEKGIALIKESDFDIVVLDLFKDGEFKDEDAGIKVLEVLRGFLFIPVIFYTGHSYKIADYKSEVIGVVNKGDGIDALSSELGRIIKSKLALLRKNINEHISKELKQYFWDIVDIQKNIFNTGSIDYSLGYLILRRIATSLSKENIKVILGDDNIRVDKVHPMEFYLYPLYNSEYEAGEILEKDGNYFTILTPDCDMVLRSNGQRKTNRILLAAANSFTTIPDYTKYKDLKAKQDKTEKEKQQLLNLEGKLKNWIGNRGGEQDRFFFLPCTPFIENMMIDFQNKIMVTYDDLKFYRRVAKLDMPFAQSMISSFIRYYNRIGFPDIDAEYIFHRLM